MTRRTDHAAAAFALTGPGPRRVPAPAGRSIVGRPTPKGVELVDTDGDVWIITYDPTRTHGPYELVDTAGTVTAGRSIVGLVRLAEHAGARFTPWPTPPTPTGTPA